jgi:DNA-directed RNA polymerase specialized sigma24 family protein
VQPAVTKAHGGTLHRCDRARDAAADVPPRGPPSASPRRSRVYETEAPRLLIVFARRTCDPQAALDLDAETFAAAYARRRRFRGGTDKEARAWLYGIAHHKLARFGLDPGPRPRVATAGRTFSGAGTPTLAAQANSTIREDALSARLPPHAAEAEGVEVDEKLVTRRICVAIR